MAKDAFTEICLKLGSKACDHGDYNLTAMLYKAGCTNQDSVEPGQLARALVTVADTYADRRRYARATELYEMALAIYSDESTAEPEEIPALLDRLAEVAYQQNRFADAVQLYERAMKMDETLRRTDPELVRKRIVKLTWLHLQQGNLERALECLHSDEP